MKKTAVILDSVTGSCKSFSETVLREKSLESRMSDDEDLLAFEPNVSREGSIGVEDMASLVIGAVQSTDTITTDDIIDAKKNEDEPEWLQNPDPPALLPAPDGTQPADMVESDAGEDDRTNELLKEQYITQNIKSIRMKEIFARKHELNMNPSKDPYMIMSDMHDMIEDMDEGEEKVQSVQMFNLFHAIFQINRKNKPTLEFAAELFLAQREYYKRKKEKREIDKELEQLTQLYNEQELEQTLNALYEKQKQRKAMLEAKGTVKAEKRAAEKADVGKRQKTAAAASE